MFTNRLSTLVIVIVIAALALVTASFTTSPRNSETYQDYAQRHPGLILSSASSIGSQSPDYYQRHRAEFMRAPVLDASDYFMRHPELTATRSVDTTDYFFRRAAQ